MENFLTSLTNYSAIIIAFIVGLWGLIQQIQKSKAEKPITNADAASKITDAAAKVIDQYQEYQMELKNDIVEYKNSNESLTKEINDLKTELFGLKAIILTLVRQLERHYHLFQLSN